jgi:hypothetical protein
MPENKKIIINTGPILALVAALDGLDILRELYSQVMVSYVEKEKGEMLFNFLLIPATYVLFFASF